MTIRTFNGQWLTAGGGVATSDDCCCSDSECATAADCGFDAIGSLFCCDGSCSETPCTACGLVLFGSGWFTADGVADTRALLEQAGYVDILFEYDEFNGTLPYTDGCGQTFLFLSARCCGTTTGCSPASVSGSIRGLVGPGNQFPPCGAPDADPASVSVCCNPFP